MSYQPRPYGHKFGVTSINGGFAILGDFHGDLIVQVNNLTIISEAGNVADSLRAAILDCSPSKVTNRHDSNSRRRIGKATTPHDVYPSESDKDARPKAKRRLSDTDRISVECFIRQSFERQRHSRIPALHKPQCVIFRARRYIPDPARIVEPPLFSKLAEKAMRAIDAGLDRTELYRFGYSDAQGDATWSAEHCNLNINDYMRWARLGCSNRADQSLQRATTFISSGVNTCLVTLLAIANNVLSQQSQKYALELEFMISSLLATFRAKFGAIDPLSLLLETGLKCIQSQVHTWQPIALNYLCHRVLLLIQSYPNLGVIVPLLSDILIDISWWRDYEGVARHAQKLMKICQASPIPNELGQHVVRHRLADFEIARGNYSYAIELLQRTRAYFLSCRSNAIYLNSVLNSLARAHKLDGNVSEARRFYSLTFQHALEVYGEGFGATFSRFVDFYNHLGKYEALSEQNLLQEQYPYLVKLYHERYLRDTNISITDSDSRHEASELVTIKEEEEAEEEEAEEEEAEEEEAEEEEEEEGEAPRVRPRAASI